MSLPDPRRLTAQGRTTRPRQAAPRPRARFPRLHAAWALLLSAGVAHADATPPKSGTGNGTVGSGNKGKKTPCPTGQSKKPGGPKKDDEVELGGVVGSITRAPRAPVFATGSDGELVLHPHGPDQPCKKRIA